MDTDVSTSSASTSSPGRIVRRREPGTAPTATISSMFPADPPPPPPVAPSSPPAARPSLARRAVVPVLVAAAVVLALAASVGVGVLWSANRKLADEVEAAVAQTAATQQQLAELRATTPTAEALEALVGRVEQVEAWTGLPADGQGRTRDLQTRLVDVTGDADRLQNDVRTGLADVRAGLAALQREVDGATDAVTDDDLDGLRRQVDDLRSDVTVLCWAVEYQPEVAASC